ncbi:MAG: YggS family pyridoxal phosphate-dependent enzyme [Elusimicrobia bacterium]|nr:YggS family pyridoxal phosphate-dependent enzyme [Elusimicrobiota bacterium]
MVSLKGEKEAFFDNWGHIQAKVSLAAQKSGRADREIAWVAVTKGVPGPRVRLALEAGISNLGESRIQEAVEKMRLLGFGSSLPFQGIRWHFLGRLQTNKAKIAVRHFHLIQSLDRLSLAEAIEREAFRQEKIQDCLVQVKIAENPTQGGIEPGKLPEFLEILSSKRHLRILGMMCMAPFLEPVEKVRPYFSKAREIFEKQFGAFSLPQKAILSMGMSRDFEIAVEEGSTMVRIGTLLFREPTQTAR